MANKTNKNQPAGEEEEILIRDENGEFKVLKGGKFLPLKEEIKEESKAQAPLNVPTPPPVKAVPPKTKTKPVFDFYPEDEEEVKKIKKEMAGLKPVEITKINEISEDLIKRLNLSLADELLKSRFKEVIISRLKDIRDPLETKDVLLKKKEEGGLGLNKDQTDQIIKELNKLVGLIIKPTTTRDIKETKGPRQPLRIAPPPPALVTPPAAKPIRPSSPPPLPQVKKIMEESTRPQMVDVKFTPKLVGPVEELERLNLVDFRRLSRDPKVAGQKIIDKISLLEEESFEKRILGIRAWQASEVYKIYLAIGEESIKQGKPVRSVIQERQNQNKPTLTEAEFLAIMELNKNLKF